jgi:hypothetical protein
MPAVVAMLVVLWILLVLTVVGAVVLANMLHRLRHRPIGSARVFTPLDADDQDSTIDDPDDVEHWLRYEWSYTSPVEATAWWWSPAGSAPQPVVIEGGYRSGAAAVAEKPARQQTAAIKQIWTIHPDHTAHWEDEASGCPWCRNEQV